MKRFSKSLASTNVFYNFLESAVIAENSVVFVKLFGALILRTWIELSLYQCTVTHS